jgi:hypothetical protein
MKMTGAELPQNRKHIACMERQMNHKNESGEIEVALSMRMNNSGSKGVRSGKPVCSFRRTVFCCKKKAKW